MKEKKRLFQVLDEMNLEDIQNNTTMVRLSNIFISGNLTKRGAEITMGADAQCLNDIMNAVPILILVDKEEYFKRRGDEKLKT